MLEFLSNRDANWFKLKSHAVRGKQSIQYSVMRMRKKRHVTVINSRSLIHFHSFGYRSPPLSCCSLKFTFPPYPAPSFHLFFLFWGGSEQARYSSTRKWLIQSLNTDSLDLQVSPIYQPLNHCRLVTFFGIFIKLYPDVTKLLERLMSLCKWLWIKT